MARSARVRAVAPTSTETRRPARDRFTALCPLPVGEGSCHHPTGSSLSYFGTLQVAVLLSCNRDATEDRLRTFAGSECHDWAGLVSINDRDLRSLFASHADGLPRKFRFS